MSRENIIFKHLIVMSPVHEGFQGLLIVVYCCWQQVQTAKCPPTKHRLSAYATVHVLNHEIYLSLYLALVDTQLVEGTCDSSCTQ